MAALVFGFGDEGAPPSDFADDITEQYEGASPMRVTEYIVKPALGIGVVGLAAAAFGVFSLLRERRGRALGTVPWWVLGSLLQVMLLWLISDLVSWRYLLPATPIFIVLAAVGIVHTTRAVSGHGQRRTVALGFALVLAALYGYRSADYLRRESREATQQAARMSIEKHVPAGSGIALEGLEYFPSEYMPRLRHTRGSLLAAAAANEGTDPGKADLIRRYAVEALGKPGYDIHLYRFRDHANTAAWTEQLRKWRHEGIRYIVKRHSVAAAGDFGKSVEALESALKDVGAELMSWGTLCADGITLRGPDLRIYALEAQ